MSEPKKIVFVYNADSGVFNLLSDIGHKLFTDTPGVCSLCDLTHDPLSMKNEWKQFIESLPHETAFEYKDKFHKDHPELSSVTLPAVFLLENNALKQIVTSEEIGTASDLKALETILSDALSAA